jgi:hypothetical protein
MGLACTSSWPKASVGKRGRKFMDRSMDRKDHFGQDRDRGERVGDRLAPRED